MAKFRLDYDLTAEQLRSAIDYDPATGLFVWKVRFDKPSQWNGKFVGKIAGHNSERLGYVLLRFNTKGYRAHRLAWLYMTGSWPNSDIDHIDRNGFNNSWSNLRLATQSQNNMNIRAHADRPGGLKGAYWNKRNGRWLAQIRHEGKQFYLGFHDTAEAAHEAYCRKAVELFGEYARFS